MSRDTRNGMALAVILAVALVVAIGAGRAGACAWLVAAGCLVAMGYRAITGNWPADFSHWLFPAGWRNHDDEGQNRQEGSRDDEVDV